MKKVLFLTVFSLVFITGIFALGSGTSNADFLKIGVGARPEAMAGAFSGVADDANAIFFNPAGISLIDKWSATFMHLIWYNNVNYEFGSIIVPVDNLTNIGIGFNYLSVPSFNSTVNSSGVKLLPDAPASYDMAISISAGRNLGNLYTKDFTIGNISIGANLKYIKRELLGKALPSSFLIDLGLIANITESIRAGLVFSDMGQTTGEDNAPLSTKLGLCFNYDFSKDFGIILSSDVIKPIDTMNPDYKKWFIDFGSELKIFNILFIRGGYKIGNEDESFSAGAGIAVPDLFSVDYAFSPHKELGDAHRISLSVKFGERVPRPSIGAPRPPEKVVAIAGDRIVSIGWEPNPEANITGYNIYYKEKKADKFIKLNKEPIMEEAKYKAVLNNDIEYEFVVTAINNRGLESIYSEKAVAKPTKYIAAKPPKVTGVIAKIEAGNIIIMWNESTDKNVVGYNLYYKKLDDKKYKKLNKSLLKETKATLGGLTTGVEYNFLVTAVGKDGSESDFSDTVSAKLTGEEEYY